MERSVLFFDIDGTVLSEITRQVPESAVRAFKAAQEEGHLLFINTGRTACCVPPTIRKYRFDGYLCGCGTNISYKEEELFYSSIDRKRGKAIIDKLLECGMTGIAEARDDVYFPERVTQYDGLEGFRRSLRERGIGVEQPLERENFTYDKMFIYENEKSDLKSFLAFIEEDMNAIDRGDGAYEVIQKRYSKGTACEQVLKLLGIPKERAYVFGDSSNDLDMFRFADHAVAMGKHADVLEPYTEFVTKTVEEDGLAYAMKHYGLIH